LQVNGNAFRTAQSDLLRKFEEFAFDESAEARWRESQRAEADVADEVSVSEPALQNDLFESSGNPF
jgi:hypothetical protein